MHFEGIGDTLSEDVGRHIVSFLVLDVLTLVHQKAVFRSWQTLFTNTIGQKASTPKAFHSRMELKEAVTKYAKYNSADAEEFAQTYGLPIDRWDVSSVQDFSFLFTSKKSFNDSIGSWNTANVTHMESMFVNATSFNQDISSWNTSNITHM
eukprot:scaffold12492_cov51-Attheya_sp.AAC.5